MKNDDFVVKRDFQMNNDQTEIHSTSGTAPVAMLLWTATSIWIGYSEFNHSTLQLWYICMKHATNCTCTFRTTRITFEMPNDAKEHPQGCCQQPTEQESNWRSLKVKIKMKSSIVQLSQTIFHFEAKEESEFKLLQEQLKGNKVERQNPNTRK